MTYDSKGKDKGKSKGKPETQYGMGKGGKPEWSRGQGVLGKDSWQQGCKGGKGGVVGKGLAADTRGEPRVGH